MTLKGKIVAVSGVDGCGKSTIISEVISELEKRGKSCRYVWLRYNHYLTKGLLAFCRLAGLTKYEYFDGVRVGYHEFYRSKIISHMFIWLTYVDTLMASVVRVYIPAVFSDKVIVCDRWAIDIMVDLEVDTGIAFESGDFYHRMFTALLLKGSRSFIVDRDLELVRQVRKENVHDRNFLKRVKLYLRHGKHGYAAVVENNGEIGSAVDRILHGVQR